MTNPLRQASYRLNPQAEQEVAVAKSLLMQQPTTQVGTVVSHHLTQPKEWISLQVNGDESFHEAKLVNKAKDADEWLVTMSRMIC